MQLKEALLHKEKESNSSRKEFKEKTKNNQFLHETSILNHKCEQMPSNDLENLNMVNQLINFFF